MFYNCIGILFVCIAGKSDRGWTDNVTQLHVPKDTNTANFITIWVMTMSFMFATAYFNSKRISKESNGGYNCGFIWEAVSESIMKWLPEQTQFFEYVK